MNLDQALAAVDQLDDDQARSVARTLAGLLALRGDSADVTWAIDGSAR